MRLLDMSGLCPDASSETRRPPLVVVNLLGRTPTFECWTCSYFETTNSYLSRAPRLLGLWLADWFRLVRFFCFASQTLGA